MKTFIILGALLAVAYAQKYNQYATPVPILKQLNKHNDDGSYSYGYEGGDGTFKIETKYPDGQVFGKYGYVDDSGKVREVEYGASRRGFEPTGNEINVPPPTLNNNYNAVARPLGPNEEDDGQYREDPSIYYKNDVYNRNNNNNQRPAFRQQSYQQPAYQQPAYQPPVYQPTPQTTAYRPAPQYNFATQPRYNPVPPAYPNYNHFNGHPASNVDINTGSYSVSYTGR